MSVLNSIKFYFLQNDFKYPEYFNPQLRSMVVEFISIFNRSQFCYILKKLTIVKKLIPRQYSNKKNFPEENNQLCWL